MGFWANIQGFLHRWSDAWVLFTAVGTMALAIATFCVIWQGRKQRMDGERQHRDRLKPICVLTPFDNIDPWNGRADLITRVDPPPENRAFGRVIIYYTLKNIGTGPAVNLRLRFRFLDMNGWMTEPWELAPLGAGEQYGSTAARIVVPVRICEEFNESDFYSITGKMWEIWLDYKDVFGGVFQTVHSKLLFDPNPSTFKWTTPPEGQQPKAIMRPIPWLAYVEPKEP
jgi:hypothetical protein